MTITCFHFEYNSFKNFECCIKDKNLVLFGTGVNGKKALDDISSITKVLYFIDNDPWRRHTKFCGFDVFTPEFLLKEDKKKLVVLITHNFIFDAEEQLLRLGVEYYFAYAMFFDIFICNENRIDITLDF